VGVILKGNRSNLYSKNKVVLILIFLILFISAVVYRNFLFSNKFYIYTDIGSDTFDSYWPYLSYLSKALWDGEFPFWSFNIGIGTNIFSANYLFTDPFNILLFILGKNNLAYALPYVAILKILLAGLFFYKYISEFNVSRFSALIVSLMYSFNGYIILWGQHYQFATIMVLLPLLLYAVEIWIKNNKWVLFACTIALISIHYYYFLYMVTLYSIIYILFRYLYLSSFNIKKIIIFIAKTSAVYILGIGISSIFLFPAIHVVINSPRVSGNLISESIFTLGSIWDYVSIILRLFSNNITGIGNEYFGPKNYYEAPILYSGLISLLLVPQIFKFGDKKTKTFAIIISLLVIISLTFMYVTYLMNGFSSASYRWTFLLIPTFLLLASVTITKIESNEYDRRLLFETLLFLIGLVLMMYLFVGIGLHWNATNIINNFKKYAAVVIILLIIYTLLFIVSRNIKNMVYFRVILLLVVSIELIYFSNGTVDNRVTMTTESMNAKIGYNDYSNEALSYINSIDKGVFRLDKSYNSGIFPSSLSDSLIQDYHGVKSYNSLNQPNYLNFLRNLEVPFQIMNHPNYITGFDSRFQLQSLVGVKYYLTKGDKNEIPYGYKVLNKFNDITVYKNNNYLPLGFTYNKYIPLQEFTSLNKEQKDEAILKGFVWEGEGLKYSKVSSEDLSNHALENEKIDLSKVQFNNIKVVQNYTKNEITIQSLNNDPQIYIPIIDREITNVDGVTKKYLSVIVKSDINSLAQVYWGNSLQELNEANSKLFPIDAGEKEYIIDLGIIDASLLRFDVGQNTGLYTLKDLTIGSKIIGTTYSDDISKLKENSLQVKRFDDSYLSGEIFVDENKLLFLSIPFDEGWSLKVDGNKRKIEKVNFGFIGVFLEKGTHEIELKYTPPYMQLGFAVTCLSVLILLIALIRLKKKKEIV